MFSLEEHLPPFVVPVSLSPCSSGGLFLHRFFSRGVSSPWSRFARSPRPTVRQAYGISLLRDQPRSPGRRTTTRWLPTHGSRSARARPRDGTAAHRAREGTLHRRQGGRRPLDQGRNREGCFQSEGCAGRSSALRRLPHNPTERPDAPAAPADIRFRRTN